jgi:DNA-binding response OmpR family regulator
MMDILIVEDNEELANLIETFLQRDGYHAVTATSGEAALQYLEEHAVELVLLDIMLPGIDGFAVCTQIRKKDNIPILIMSAKVDKEDKMNGFLLGADDYMEKPVDVDILSAKIAALLRRSQLAKEKNARLESGSISIDMDAKQVFYQKHELNLTVKEYELLLLLAKNAGKTLNKDYLFNQIWGADSFSENQTLTVHIKMLRDKIEDNPKQPLRIKTVWGVGYRYEEI